MMEITLLFVIGTPSPNTTDISPPFPAGYVDLFVSFVAEMRCERAGFVLTDQLAVLPAHVKPKALRLEGTERRHVLVLLLEI